PYPSIQSTLKQSLCQSRLRPPRLYPQGRRGSFRSRAYSRPCGYKILQRAHRPAGDGTRPPAGGGFPTGPCRTAAPARVLVRPRTAIGRVALERPGWEHLVERQESKPGTVAERRQVAVGRERFEVGLRGRQAPGQQGEGPRD